MPIGAQDHLEGLYGRQRLLSAEASRLESERDLLGKNSDRRYSPVQRGGIYGRTDRETVPDPHAGRCASRACPRRRTRPERVIGHNLMTDVLHA